MPIKDTLISLFGHASVRQQYRSTHETLPKEGVFDDLSDGKVFRSSKFFQDIPSALRLILYQNGFDVTNPLGSGKNKHKILPVYLADLFPHNRSPIDHIQLVLLFREQDLKRFGHQAVFGHLVQDLKGLECNGIAIAEGTMIVKGTICAIVGDNLGSHCVGGFTQNFSTSRYFCRYCLLNRESFMTEPYSCGPVRSVQSYIESVEALNENPDGDNLGIKFSLFNAWKIFTSVNQGYHPV